MNLRFVIIRFIAATLLLWGLGVSALHSHEAHEDEHSTPCDVCLIMTTSDEQGAAIALTANEFTLNITPQGDHDFTLFASRDIVSIPVRGPPKRGPPSIL